MPTNNFSRCIPSLGTSHLITLMSNGFNLGNPLPTSMNVGGFGDNRMCQAWWIKWSPNACNSINVPHVGLGSNVETWMSGIFYGLDIASSPFGSSSQSWMLPSNSSKPCERPKNLTNIVNKCWIFQLAPNEPQW